MPQQDLHEISRLIGNLEAKIDLILVSVRDLRNDHDARLTELEKSTNAVTTVSGSVAAGVAALTAGLSHLIK